MCCRPKERGRPLYFIDHRYPGLSGMAVVPSGSAGAPTTVPQQVSYYPANYFVSNADIDESSEEFYDLGDVSNGGPTPTPMTSMRNQGNAPVFLQFPAAAAAVSLDESYESFQERAFEKVHHLVVDNGPLDNVQIMGTKLQNVK